VGELSVYLLDGFARDRVEVTVDDRVLREDDVTTQLLLGHAATLATPVQDGPARLEVRVPTRGLAAGLDLNIRGDAHVLVSIEAERLTCQLSEAAPGFL
jgi:hypothetical protein